MQIKSYAPNRHLVPGHFDRPLPEMVRWSRDNPWFHVRHYYVSYKKHWLIR